MNVDRISRALIALAVLAGIGAALVPLVNDLFNRHLLSVRVAGKFDHLSRHELEAVVREQLRSSGFFEVDVESLRRAALSLPWVRDVTVRRVWPDSVHITVVERVAAVRWNDDALLENDATVFKPREGVKAYALPQLYGPVGRHAQVLDQFRRLSTGLGTVGGGVAGLSLSERGQWEVNFANGMTVVPSTPFDVAALMQFSRMLPSILGADLHRAARIDLRYANGFAVRWHESEREGEGEVGGVAVSSGVTDERKTRSRGGRG